MNEHVAGRIGAELVKQDDGARRIRGARQPLVDEAGAVGQPGDGAGAAADFELRPAAGRGIDEPQHPLLVIAGYADRQPAAVRRRHDPPRLGAAGWVDIGGPQQRPLLAEGPVARKHRGDGFGRVPVPVEVAIAADERQRQVPALRELGEPPLQFGASGCGVEHGARVAPLRVRPRGNRRPRSFQPSIVVGDGHAVQCFVDRVDTAWAAAAPTDDTRRVHIRRSRRPPGRTRQRCTGSDASWSVARPRRDACGQLLQNRG